MTEVQGRTVCANASLGWAWWPFLSNCIQDGAGWLVVLPVAASALAHTILIGSLQGQHAGMRAACMQVRRTRPGAQLHHCLLPHVCCRCSMLEQGNMEACHSCWEHRLPEPHLQQQLDAAQKCARGAACAGPNAKALNDV